MMANQIMRPTFDEHTPVLLQEAVDYLVGSPDGVYVDATFGRGSHTREILQRLSSQGRLIAFDKDLDAVTYARNNIQDARFSIFHCSFASMQLVLTELHLAQKIHGILFDLGVSSQQLSEGARGFSFVREGKLDMRMDQSQGVTAATFLATIAEDELASILWQYGEEKKSRRIAKAIVAARELAPIETTTALADIIEKVCPRSRVNYHKHPATRSFQAIRIAINRELVELEEGLLTALLVLMRHGRLVAISFHSLEDRIVKQFIRQHEKGVALPRGLPIKGEPFQGRMKTVTGHIKPSLDEMHANPRARSAILRVSEKLS